MPRNFISVTTEQCLYCVNMQSLQTWHTWVCKEIEVSCLQMISASVAAVRDLWVLSTEK